MRDQTRELCTPPGLVDGLRLLMQERRMPGVQVAVVRDDRIVTLTSLGLANLEHQVPTGHQSVFSVNSMAKAFTGVALMQLVEAGELDLDARASYYLDNLPDSWSAVTVGQLATLTSGLPEIMRHLPDGGVGLLGDGTEESAWQVAYDMPMEFAPGTGYNYVQTNYALLGKIIDRLRGQPFTEFIAERQFAVAGMPNTLYADDRDIIPGRANTYMSINPEGDPTGRIGNSRIDWPPILRTAAGLHSTAEDLANWLIALCDGRLLQQASSLETLWTPVPLHDGRPGLWGVGWLVFQRDVGMVRGPAGAAKAQIAMYPDGLSVILLTNLLGAITEQQSLASAEPMDLDFMDHIAAHYR